MHKDRRIINKKSFLYSLLIVAAAIILITSQDVYAGTTGTTAHEPFKVDNTQFNFDDYENYEEEYCYITAEGDFNDISSAVSSNSKVVKVRVVKDINDYGDACHVVEVRPVGVGTAKITVTDQYGQKVIVPVTATQKFFDEARYLDDLTDSLQSMSENGMVYGDTEVRVASAHDPEVYVIIKGKKYTGSEDDKGHYVIGGLPKLPAGTKITVIIKKGQAKASETLAIEKKKGADLTAKPLKSQVYSGKAFKPAIIIKHGKYILKKGRDYTIQYSNNKKIGKAKATVKFKGNYKGSKAVYFNIVPKGTSVSGLTSVRGGFILKWKMRSSNISGYQIQYSQSKDDLASGQKKTFNSNKTIKSKVTKLHSGKKYYVRVRTFKKVGSKKFYSAWSKTKAVNVK